MRKNLVPLLVVAFVVAVLSTGIFYGLFVGKLSSAPNQQVISAARTLKAGTVISAADLGTSEWAGRQIPKGMFTNTDPVIGKTVLEQIEQGEPVIQSRLVSRDGAGGGGGVPEGMRAVSVHVTDSSGVLALLKPGHRVDVQVFATRQTPQGPENEARTAFQNIRVLAVNTHPEQSSQNGFNAPVVTLLVTPREADSLGVADSFGRIRLALRNPGDEAQEPKSTLPLAAVFRPGHPAAPSYSAPPAPVPAGTPAKAAAPQRTQVGLAVQLVSASSEAVTRLRKFGLRGRPDVLDAAEVTNIDKVLAELRENKSLDVLSLSQVNAAVSRSAAVELDARQSGGVRVQFSPFVANGQMKLRVQPELRGDSGTRRMETEVDITSGRSFVISGLRDSTSTEAGRQMLVVVKPNL